MKLVIVINGAGGVGKDTLCAAAATRYKVRNTSSILPVKEIASACGWNGKKDAASRKFLSDLKALLTAYNDYPNRWVLERVREFLQSDDEILFVHIRECSEIAKFVTACPCPVKTLLVRGGKRFAVSHYGNASDDDVENYRYDYTFDNDAPLAETTDRFCAFLGKILDDGAHVKE